MTEKPFEVGEIVYLNSGSPALTVFNLLPDDFVRVTWMAGAEVRSTKFPRAAMTRESPGFDYRASPGAPVAVAYGVVAIDPEIERRAMEIYKGDGMCHPNYPTVAMSWADEQERIREIYREKARAQARGQIG